MHTSLKKRLILSIMILFTLFSNVWASGENEEDYIKFGSISDDKRVIIKAHTLIVKQMNRIYQSFNNDADASYDQHLAIYNYESEKIHKSEPMLWETDAQFQQRKTEELELLLEKINSEFEVSIDAIAKPYEEELETFIDEFEKNITQLQKKESIEISGDAIDFDTYLRNDRLWPISLRLSNAYIPESTINVVVDFIGNNRTEPEIRSSIIEFDQARKDNQLSATLNYHIVPDYKFNANIQVIRYLVVIDSISLLHNTKNIRYTRTLDVPALLHSISLDEKLNLVDSQKDRRIGISNLKHTSFDYEQKELRSIQKPILLWSSSNNITDIQEKNRLSDLYTENNLGEPVVPAAVPKAKGKVPAAPAKDAVIFKLVNGAEPESLDPHQIQGVPEYRIYETIFEGLVAHDPKTATALPGLAKSWTASEDGTQYTFHLRDAVWSDGVKITAQTVVDSWLRGLNPKTASPYAWFPAMFIKGAEEYNWGVAGKEAVGIRALNEKTFQMDLIGPLPYAIDALAHYSFAVVPLHAIEKYGATWIRPEKFVGNGPYTLKEWVPQSYIKAVPNPSYWDKDVVKLDEVIFYALDDNNTAYNMYLNGEVDWSTDIPIDQRKAASLRRDYHKAPQVATYYYIFHTERAPFDDVRIRKALSMSFDRQALVDQVTRGGQIPAWGIVPRMAGYAGLGEPTYDIVAARKLLADAGYPNGVGFPKTTVIYNTSDAHKTIAEFLQQEWKKNLNITLKLENQEWATYLNNRNVGNFQFARAGWVGDYQDPNTFLDMFITGGGMNNGRYSNEIYDILIKEAATMSGADRMDVLLQAENILVNEDQAVMNIYYYTTDNMIDTAKWGGWYPNTMDYHPLKNIYLK